MLHGVSLEVAEGETVALLGTNGNGKSTLIKCIMGLVRPDRGEIFFETNGRRVDLIGRAPEEIGDHRMESANLTPAAQVQPRK